jgi:hypothetical protein
MEGKIMDYKTRDPLEPINDLARMMQLGEAIGRGHVPPTPQAEDTSRPAALDLRTTIEDALAECDGCCLDTSVERAHVAKAVYKAVKKYLDNREGKS